MLTITPCVHLTKYAYFAGIHSFATQLNEYKLLQDIAAINKLQSLSLRQEIQKTKSSKLQCSLLLFPFKGKQEKI